MKIIDKIIPYCIIFWFMVVSFATIITLIDLIPTLTKDIVFGIKTSSFLSWITVLFGINMFLLIYWYIIKEET
jgi:hypothetical protein